MKINILLLALTVVLIAPNFIDKDINETEPYNHTERYYPFLQSLSTVDQLESYIDLMAASKGIKKEDPGYAMFVSYIVSCRFFHGFSHWNLNQNWIAALAQKITGTGLACKVQPEAIMKDNFAGCSQQVLVMMDIFRRKGISYRKVGFPHHYTIEVASQGKWYFFDPDLEPAMNLSQREHSAWQGKGENLKQFYVAKVDQKDLDFHFGDSQQKAELGIINEVPAANLRAFQNVTALLSKILFFFPLFILYRRVRSLSFARKENLQPTVFQLIAA
jgi:hypothetical protein